MADPHALGIPLDAHTAARLKQLEDLSQCEAGRGRAADGRHFVDLVDVYGELRGRWHGETLHLAIGAALKACGGGT